MAWQIQHLSSNWLGRDWFGGPAPVFSGSKHTGDSHKGGCNSLLVQGQTFAGRASGVTDGVSALPSSV